MQCEITHKILEESQKNNADSKEYTNQLLSSWVEMSHYLPSKLGKVLDIGCAYGTYTAFLSNYGKIYACDIEKMADVNYLNSRNIKFNLWNPEIDDPRPDYKDFDNVFLTDVIEHFSYSPIPALENIYSTLKQGGRLYITTPVRTQKNVDYCSGRYCAYLHYKDIPEAWNGYKFEDAHHHIYTAQELGQAVEEVGFKVKEIFPICKGHTYFLIAEK